MELAGIFSEFAPAMAAGFPILGIRDRLVVRIVEVVP